MISFETIKKELSDLEVLTLTVYGEARGEGLDGIAAVTQVILNRAKSSGRIVKDVCLEPKQFSCWNMNDPNYPMLNELAMKILYDESPKFDNSYKQVELIVNGVNDKLIVNQIGLAKNYMTTNLYMSSKKPSWANSPKASKVIGNHIFLVI